MEGKRQGSSLLIYVGNYHKRSVMPLSFSRASQNSLQQSKATAIGTQKSSPAPAEGAVQYRQYQNSQSMIHGTHRGPRLCHVACIQQGVRLLAISKRPKTHRPPTLLPLPGRRRQLFN